MAGYLGMLLLGSSLTALGLWGSSLSKSQIVGFIVSCLLCLTLSVVGVVAMFVPESLGAVFEFLSVRYHFENLARGVIDTRDVLYYLSVTAIGLALTTTSLQTIRR
jgi:ABC-2 type transport system permease protein